FHLLFQSIHHLYNVCHSFVRILLLNFAYPNKYLETRGGKRLECSSKNAVRKIYTFIKQERDMQYIAIGIGYIKNEWPLNLILFQNSRFILFIPCCLCATIASL